MITVRLAIASLWNRRFSSVLTLASVALSVALFVGVERVRQGARASFTNTISGTDLIVGARGGSIQLLLYTVFRLGTATANISYETYTKLAEQGEVLWTIPYSLGDSHRGFRVVGTNEDFYRHYRFRGDQRPEFAAGGPATGIFDVVLGGEVAGRLGYQVGQKIILAHGVAEVVLQKHEDKPFVVTGILKKTATPIDRSLYITLQGMEAMHIDWGDGAPPRPGQEVKAESLTTENLKIKAITAFLVGLKSRLDVLRMQRAINDYEDEPLLAIIPGVALAELWDGIAYAEDGLRVVSFFVVVVGLLGMLIAIYNSLSERRREMAILRSLGAAPRLIFALMVIEAVLLTSVGALLGVAAMYGLVLAINPVVEQVFGLVLPITWPSLVEAYYLLAIVGLGVLLGVVPAWRAYRHTLSDGLTIRV